jgi:hypothetical protein
MSRRINKNDMVRFLVVAGGVDLHKYTNTQIHKYTNTQIHKYKDIKIQKNIKKASRND